MRSDHVSLFGGGWGWISCGATQIVILIPCVVGPYERSWEVFCRLLLPRISRLEERGAVSLPSVRIYNCLSFFDIGGS